MTITSLYRRPILAKSSATTIARPRLPESHRKAAMIAVALVGVAVRPAPAVPGASTRVQHHDGPGGSSSGVQLDHRRAGRRPSLSRTSPFLRPRSR